MTGRKTAAQYLVGGDTRLLKTYRRVLRRLDVLERGVRAHLATYQVSQGKNKLKAPLVAEDRRLRLHADAGNLIKAVENLPVHVWRRDELLARAKRCRGELNESQIEIPIRNLAGPVQVRHTSDVNDGRMSGTPHGESSLLQPDRKSSRNADGCRAGRRGPRYIRIVSGGLPTLGRR